MVSSWWIKGAELLLVVVAAWMVSDLFVEKGSKVSLGVMSSQNSSNASVSVNDRLLQEVNLFGLLEKETVEAPVVVTSSKLDVRLIGTIVAGKNSAAMVLLAGSKEQSLFFVGESMQPNVMLHGVEPTEITVDNNGSIERIALEEGEQIEVPVIRERPTRQVQPRINMSKVDRNVNRGRMEKELRNFSTLLSQARITPHFTDKKADGFTISEIVKGSFYEEVGLQNGDVIQKVNGESVTSAEQAMRMYKELQNSTSVDVEIVRGGTVQQVSYTIQ